MSVSEADTLTHEADYVARGIVGLRPAEVSRIRHGVMAHKFLVRFSGAPPILVRFYPKDRKCVVLYEPDVLIEARKVGVAVPKVLGDSRTGPKSSHSYVAYAFVPGVTLESRIEAISRDKLAELCRSLHAHLHRLSTVPIAGFGGLRCGVTAEHRTWHDFLAACIEEFRQVPPSLAGGWPLSAAAFELQARLSCVAAPSKPSLSWGDLSPGNIILDESDKLAALIDFEGALAAEPALDLGYLRARAAGTRLYEMFSATSPEPPLRRRSRSALYAVVRALRLAPHAGTPLPTGAKRDPLPFFLPGVHQAAQELLDILRANWRMV